jgi:UDP-N-acetylmuramoyl-tripeptide--D-alanyl-D-alanine ligase
MSAEKTDSSLLTFDELLRAVHGKYVGFARNTKHFGFTSVATDSRNVVAGTLFIPLIGEKQDGHAYIPQAVEKGATVIFVASSSYKQHENKYMELVSGTEKVVLIVVENTLHALQDAAAAYVKKFPRLIRVSVTGSSGKTTTKEITAAILSQKYKVITNEGNLNSETGLPLSAFRIRSEHELALLEMGMNRRNEIGELAAVFRPQYAAITNIGTAHIGILGSRQAIADEKKKIFSYMEKDGTAVIPASDDFASFLAEGVRGKIVFYGRDVKDSGVAFVSDDGLDGTTFTVDGVTAHLHLPGVYNYNDALAAIALGKALGVSAEQIKNGVESIEPIFGRSQVIHGTYDVLQDCYNANPDSMERSLEFCASVSHKGKKIFVLGDMLELGAESHAAHAHAGELAARKGASMIVFIGTEMSAAYAEAEKIAGGADGAKKNNNPELVYISAHDDAAIQKAASSILSFAQPGDLVLLKASRGMKLERITPLLSAGTKEAADGKL